MALLQAARAYTLGLPLESAHSWGLNRAIFYAAAKRGFKGGGGGTSTRIAQKTDRVKSTKEKSREYYLGDDLAFLGKSDLPDGGPIFVIGGKEQTEDDFEKQIEARFATPNSFKRAWEEALDYVQHFEKETLQSASRFYSDVYRPKRDVLASEWSSYGEKGAQATPRRRATCASR